MVERRLAVLHSLQSYTLNLLYPMGYGGLESLSLRQIPKKNKASDFLKSLILHTDNTDVTDTYRFNIVS